MKKDKQTVQTGKSTPQAPVKSGTRKPAQTQGKGTAKPAAPEQPSIKDKIAAGRKEIDAKKSAPAPSRAAAQTKAAGLGD
jgi:hypothetical protein